MIDKHLFEDVQITHEGGATIIKGVPQTDIKSFRDSVRNSSGKAGSLTFRGVKQIDVLRPDGSPEQTIFGEPSE